MDEGGGIVRIPLPPKIYGDRTPTLYRSRENPMYHVELPPIEGIQKRRKTWAGSFWVAVTGKGGSTSTHLKEGGEEE